MYKELPTDQYILHLIWHKTESSIEETNEVITCGNSQL